MLVPIGRRRIVLTLTVLPAPKAAPPDVPAAVGASDTELARLGARFDLEGARWEALRMLRGTGPL